MAIESAPAKAGRMSAADAALWLAAAAIVSHAFVFDLPIPFVNDGYVYYAMVASLVDQGSLAFENGYAEHGSKALMTFHFIPVDGRLMPQYPSGWAFLAAPFYALGGIHGLILLNVLATLMTLWLIRLAGRILFEDDQLGLVAALLYAFATYAYDYAGAVWPHAPTIACIVGGVVAGALAWRRDDLGWVLVAGLVFGFAVNLRVDAILPAAALAVWLLGVMGRPYRALVVLLAGHVPGLAVGSALNFAKFGILNPISYGHSEAGATGLAYYADLLPLLAAAALAALALGLGPVRRALARPAVALTLAAACVAVILLLPPLRVLAERLATGAAGLVLSLGFYADRTTEVLHEMPDGTIWFWGWPKKALVQSLPYAAVLIYVLPNLFRGRDRAGVALCLLVALSILLPFAYAGWVGGVANHMRYLLHLVPAVVLLAALALREIGETPRLVLGISAAVWVGVLGLLASVAAGHYILYSLQNAMAGAVAAWTAVLSVAALLLRGGAGTASRAALRGAVWVGVVIAGLSGWGADFIVHRGPQVGQFALTQKLRDLPKDALLLTTNPKWAFERTSEPQTLIASFWSDLPYDPELLKAAFAEGKAVFVQNGNLAEAVVEAGHAAEAELLLDGEKKHRLYRLVPPSD
ncbi:MAG TPA: glycosyltransferase family 39 protein [Thermohalobaculum sp.]|nr:glycosyltransferase family 39 protein [Thermohalobaculum sp.]